MGTAEATHLILEMTKNCYRDVPIISTGCLYMNIIFPVPKSCRSELSMAGAEVVLRTVLIPHWKCTEVNEYQYQYYCTNTGTGTLYQSRSVRARTVYMYRYGTILYYRSTILYYSCTSI